MKTTPNTEDIQALARSTLGGKKTNFLKGACSDELKDLLVRRLAAIRLETGRNVTESEFVEKAVAIALLGLEHVVKVEVEHQQKLAGYWSSAGQVIPGEPS